MAEESLQLDPRVMGNIEGQLAERFFLAHVKRHRQQMFARWFPETGSYHITIARPVWLPPGAPYAVGSISGNTAVRRVNGWGGDLALVNRNFNHQRRAVIFEVKSGRPRISQAQHRFFKGILSRPGDYMPGLVRVKVVIVRVLGFDCQTGTLTVRFDDYPS
jgi:hypothetical protein